MVPPTEKGWCHQRKRDGATNVEMGWCHQRKRDGATNLESFLAMIIELSTEIWKNFCIHFVNFDIINNKKTAKILKSKGMDEKDTRLICNWH